MTAIFLLTPTRASVNFVIPIGVLAEYVTLIMMYGSSAQEELFFSHGDVRFSIMDIWNTVVFSVLCICSWAGRYGIERSTREKFMELQTWRDANVEQDKRINQLQQLLALTTTFVVEVDKGFIVPSDEFCEVFGRHCALRTVRLRDLCATRESQQRVDTFLAAVRNERTPQKATLTLLGGAKREIVYCHVFGLSEDFDGSDHLSITFGFQVLEFHHAPRRDPRTRNRRLPGGDANIKASLKHVMSSDERSALQQESVLQPPEQEPPEQEPPEQDTSPEYYDDRGGPFVAIPDASESTSNAVLTL
jgi:hypothetical protein